ncbi:MAG: hypothetical protein WCJ33_01245 [Pseudomonadota bacterium]
MNQSNEDTFTVNIAEVIHAKKSLADVLTEETKYLSEMKIEKVAAIQDKKLKLIHDLEKQALYLRKNPEIISGMTLAEKKDMTNVHDYFVKAMQENYEKIMVARAINQTIVNCVASFFVNNGNSHAYNARGSIGNGSLTGISMTLNKVI